MTWDAITAIASLISMVAFVATAVFVARQLKALDRSQYLQVTSEIYNTWASREFMEAQLWLIHRLEEKSWPDFVRVHRADYGEQAFHRVGSFYDRVGTLVRLKLVNEREILSTMGAYAIAVWQKIEPLVREARKMENSVLFDDFEAIIPVCYECYVPNLQVGQSVKPFAMPDKAPLVTVPELRKKMEKHEPVTVLDVRQPGSADGYRERIPGAVVLQPDTLVDRWSELSKEKDVVAYCT